jgi:hypothetical protein
MYRHAPNFAEGLDAGKIVAVEVLARSLDAERALWRYLVSLEWASTVKARLLPLDHPLFFLLARPRQMRMRVGDGLWARLVDVGAALSARSYAAPGPVVFDVRDEFCDWNAGRWALEDGGTARTTTAADIACDVTALGSAYLGGFVDAARAREGDGGAGRGRRRRHDVPDRFCPGVPRSSDLTSLVASALAGTLLWLSSEEVMGRRREPVALSACGRSNGPACA